MFPILFSIGPFTLYTLWIFVIAGILLGTLLFLKQAKYNRMDLTLILDHGLSLFLSMMIFSRLGFSLINWGYFEKFSLWIFLKQLVYFWQPGYSFWGAVLGFGIMFGVQAWRKGENLIDWLGAFLPPLFVGIILGHIGQFFDGQGYGRETIMPWGVTFETTNVKYTVPIHPTQIYAILLIVGIFLSKKRITEKWPDLGEKRLWALTMATLYSLGRFVLEFFRGDDTLQLGWIRLGHLAWIIALGVCIWVFLKNVKSAKSVEPPCLK